MDSFADWLLGLVKSAFSALWDFFTDLLIALLDLGLSAILGLLQLLPVPSFMQAGSLQAIINQISPDIWYFASHFKLSECLAMFGAAVGFRLARKALTLFQW
ncbi:MAG: hypothetical protein H6R10_593 [Rhodocyclaceae bacterium]|nr:hypothetical protein [Rhodocyclaceae bacterium]